MVTVAHVCSGWTFPFLFALLLLLLKFLHDVFVDEFAAAHVVLTCLDVVLLRWRVCVHCDATS